MFRSVVSYKILKQVFSCDASSLKQCSMEKTIVGRQAAENAVRQACISEIVQSSKTFSISSQSLLSIVMGILDPG
jgi:hypothetical protein